MKILSYITVFGLALLVACNGTPNSAEADTTEAKIASSATGIDWKIDTAESKLLWEGAKLIGGAHSGVVPIISGNLKMSDNQIVGGSFLIDMKDLQPLDQDSASNDKLRKHLGSRDFFSVDSFPTASFAITAVKTGADTTAVGAKDANITVTGNLTIKGIAKSISFPAKLSQDSNAVIVLSTFNIDRTKWGVNYGAENSIKDKIINKEIEFMVNLKAAK